MKPIQTIQGAWSDDANGWVSEDLEITGDAWLEVTLPHKGRLVVKKSETPEGPWPKTIITPWTGPGFRIRLIHGTEKASSDAPHKRYIRIITTVEPTTIQLANI